MSEKRKLILSKYKHLITALVIISIVIILDIIFENYTKNVIQKINGNIEKIDQIFERGQNQYSQKKLRKLSQNATKEWEKREKVLTCFIEHEEVEKIDVKLRLLNTQIENEIWNEAKSTTAETKQLVKYLNKKHILSFQNVF